MKIKNLLFLFCLGVLWYGTTALDPKNPPTGNTGAPGETTCQKSGCHSGGTYTGTVTITGLPATVVAGTKYTVTAKCASATAKAGGFQLTVLDGANAKSGTLTAGTNCNVTTSGTKQYIRQSTAGTYSAGALSYTFSWTAPATSTNKDITFYCAFLTGNGNGGNGGDNAITGTQKVTFASVGTNDPILENALKVFPNPVANELNVNVLGFDNADFTLSNINGQNVISSKLSENSTFDVSNFVRGIYFATIKVGNRQAVKKVILQ